MGQFSSVSKFAQHCRVLAFACAWIASASFVSDAHAAINADQVLVVYNSAAEGADEVLQAYIAAHPDLPPENILNLDNPAIPASDLNWTQFSTLIRDPVRDHLNAPGTPSPTSIISILLLRPFPHRIVDSDAGGGCDVPATISNEFVNGDATCASIDAELVLLWQDLDAGEAGGQMDSLRDNMIDNPYHTSVNQVHLFTRGFIQAQHPFVNLSGFAWGISNEVTKLRPGDLYLVCRIDANSTEEAVSLIGRSQRLLVNKATATILFDEYDVTLGDELDDDALFTMNDPFNAGDDYEQTVAILAASDWNVIYDDTFDFITGLEKTAPLLGYASYGENHGQSGVGEFPAGDGIYIEDFNFIPGAVFNTIESFNGRALNGWLTAFGQEQVADFVGVGGTFGIGNVWEPFSFTLADNEFILPRMLASNPADRFTWAEAAYAAMPTLSWQQIVIGDPLSKFDIVDDDTFIPGDLDGNGIINAIDANLFTLLLLDGYDEYRTLFPTLDPFARADFTMDYQFNGNDLDGFVDAYLNP